MNSYPSLFAPDAQGATGAYSLPLSQAYAYPASLRQLPIRKTRQSSVMEGTIEPGSLRLYGRGVTRFRFRSTDPTEPTVSCVSFDANLSTELLTRGKRLRISGYLRENQWTDRQGCVHADTDFVARNISNV